MKGLVLILHYCLQLTIEANFMTLSKMFIMTIKSRLVWPTRNLTLRSQTEPLFIWDYI